MQNLKNLRCKDTTEAVKGTELELTAEITPYALLQESDRYPRPYELTT